MSDQIKPTPAKPYFVNTMWEHIVDNELTPYATVVVDERCTVPMEFVKHDKEAGLSYIVLNLSMTAVDALSMPKDSEYITFNARFSGKPMQVMFPYDCVVCLQAREFPDLVYPLSYEPPVEEAQPKPKGKPTLEVVK